jgi:hypothetical protein
MSAGAPKRRDVAMEKKSFALMIMMFFLLTVVHVFAEEIITNETIVTMVKAGLGEELIISKIKTSQNQFDVSTDAILKLKNEGVNEKIIQAMIEASTKKPSDVSLPATQDTNAKQKWIASMHPQHLYLKKGDTMIAIPFTQPESAATLKSRISDAFMPFYTGPGDVLRFIRGENSLTRTSEKRPFFCTKMNPSNLLLVKLNYHKDKNIRYVISKGRMYKETLPIELSRSPEGIFEVLPKEDLLPGEYAFIAFGALFYDFGIDE